jgi:hypothetical protein
LNGGYTGRFSAIDLEPVFAAANAEQPIPETFIGWRDSDSGAEHEISLHEAMVRRLEWIDAWVEITKQQNEELSPSALAKKFHAIASAAGSLLDALQVGDGSLEAMPRQIRSGLTALAEEHGRRNGGFPNHPLIHWNTREVQFDDYQGDAEIRDNVQGVREILKWAKEAEAIVRERVENPESVARAELIGVERLDADPINDAIEGILRIWTEILGREIKTRVSVKSADEGQAYGPLIDFCLACLKLLHLDKPNCLGTDAVRARIVRMSGRDFLKMKTDH